MKSDRVFRADVSPSLCFGGVTSPQSLENLQIKDATHTSSTWVAHWFWDFSKAWYGTFLNTFYWLKGVYRTEYTQYFLILWSDIFNFNHNVAYFRLYSCMAACIQTIFKAAFSFYSATSGHSSWDSHMTNMLWTYKVDIDNVLANYCLFAHPADTYIHESNMKIHQESCFWQLVQSKS